MIHPTIPELPVFYGERDAYDYKAICVFSALGFFLDDDTYHSGLKVLKPGQSYEIIQDKVVPGDAAPNPWKYRPEEIGLNEAVDQFAEIFHRIISREPDQGLILPLSGGLDSRTLAAACRHTGKTPFTFSYRFRNGHDETHYGDIIARKCHFQFRSLVVPSGYLWDKLPQLAEINQCYSEFTHPRQAAFLDLYATLGDRFLLGHWGDVLFDDMGVEEHLGLSNQVEILLKKVVKKGGLELANTLWNHWELNGTFTEYLKDRLHHLMSGINIEDSANARIRAFKSTHWAPRWTSTNLLFYAHSLPISVPYYHEDICELVCRIPEKWLKGRQIQIEYLKKYAPDLASITWQSQRPFNVHNYHLNRFPYNIPYRLIHKLKKVPVQRNWELQFTRDENDRKLRQFLFDSTGDLSIPGEIKESFYQKFRQTDSVYYSHPLSMLLTLNLYKSNGQYHV